MSTSLEVRMESYEAASDQRLPDDQPALIRIGGHGFSKFTRGFNKPFDARIHAAMVQTAAGLLTYFPGASLAYTQSDELTLVGRICKLTSLAAGYAYVRFNYHLAEAGAPAGQLEGLAHFDARCPTQRRHRTTSLIWRAKGDCRRNSIAAAKELHGMSAVAVVEKVRAEKGVDFWTATPSWAQYGTTVKREKYGGTGIDGMTGEQVETIRTRTRSEDMAWWGFNECDLELVTERYWDSPP
ncbi:tRNAHis guanylyltransferase-domain-containing protein [Mycena belliarum]|uniref:tRNA(His) guanylyltransferase n=1 Tax=Mycena belliarum TaxID=1033014 RepID=A0AAD6TUX0_9AGAR|nr:tRNAHis guanylyltransferase-domain-containing protein [Mycena belliae]